MKDKLLDNLIASRSSLDKAVLTLSSAALGFSVHFLKSLPESADAKCCMLFLILAWWSFGFSIISTALSFAFSERHNSLAWTYSEKKDEDKEWKEYSKVMFWNGATTVANFISLLFLISGIIMFLIFATVIQ